MDDNNKPLKTMREAKRVRNRIRDEFYSKIIEKLGGKKLVYSMYRLGEYNVFTSKGYALPKSNKGKAIPLRTLLKEKYNLSIDSTELNKKMIQAADLKEKDGYKIYETPALDEKNFSEDGSMKIESSKLYFRINYDVPNKIWEYYHRGFEDIADILKSIYSEKTQIDDIFVVSTCGKWHELYINTYKSIKDIQTIIKTIDLDKELNEKMIQSTDLKEEETCQCQGQ